MQRHPLPLPIFAVLAGVAMLSLMDALLKGASLQVGAYSAALLRAGLGAAIIAPVWLWREGRIPPPRVLRLHVLRGTVSAFMALTFFHAITLLPIAETIAISFVAPLIALYLAAVLLGEHIGRRAILASLLGFAGTIAIVAGRLGDADADGQVLEGVASILVSAVLYAWNFIIIRQQAMVSSPLEATTFHTGVSFTVLVLAAPWLLRLPDLPALGLIAAGAMLTVAGAMLITWAYARTQTQILIPLEYSGFLWASLFGWLTFDEQVTASTLLGTVLIVGGCWLAARRPRRPAGSAASSTIG